MTIRIGNCSGFYGDRLSAMREMLEGGDLDYLTGDWLAELTMLILGKDTFRDPNLGYARTFVRQCEDALGLAVEQGVKVVSNAGGLNPAGLADKLREVATGLGLDVNIAHIEGDDLRGHSGFTSEYGDPITANAYLGAFGISRALDAGADLVVTGRVTDASVVVGPAISAYGWGHEDLDQLASAVVAGHIIECGTQATGGNFAGFLTLPDRHLPLGFPIAEVDADGSFVITKHEGTGGAVTLDTVTAQLVYEIQSTQYLNPDVTVDLSTIELSQDGDDRVRVAGVAGSQPPEQLKVSLNYLGGFRNGADFIVTEPDSVAKMEWIKQQVTDALGDNPPARVEWSTGLQAPTDAPTEEQGAVLLRVNAFDADQDKVGKALTGPLIELALASYPGFAVTRPPASPTPYGVFQPGYVSRDEVEQVLVHADGTRETVPDPWLGAEFAMAEPSELPIPAAPAAGSTKRLPLGTFVYARSGDKGGNANVGLWIRRDQEPYEQRVAWLLNTITEEKVRELIPEAADLKIEVYPLPNLGGVNILLYRILQDGVAATSRFDPQAKSLGEWLRSRHIDIPGELL